MEDYEKKYKEALSRAATELETCGADKSLRNMIYAIFPDELKESEDEKIRKALVRFHKSTIDIDGIKGADIIAWLEKQGKQDARYKYLEELLAADDIYQMSVNDTMTKEAKEKAAKALSKLCIGKLLGFEKQGEQKARYSTIVETGNGGINALVTRELSTADKVEPKFKVGDYIVNDYCMGRVVEITNDAYLLDTEQGIPFSCEHNVHLWTIQDAIDGDVLVDKYGNIGIYQGDKNAVSWNSYCYCGVNKVFYDEGSHEFPCYPATKGQRDLLFAMMEEAGYEWDADKKELKNIEQNPVTYEMSLEYAAKRFLDTLSHSPYNRPVVDAQVVTEELLKFLANPSDYNPDAINMVKSGHAWNVEDSSKVQRICKYLDEAKKYYADITEVRECMDWLKSIEDRVQPRQKQEWSDEDETSIAINNEKAYKIGFSDGEAYAKEEMKSSWSDKDEENLQHCCGAVFAADYYTYEDKQDMEKWLLQLKERLS